MKFIKPWCLNQGFMVFPFLSLICPFFHPITSGLIGLFNAWTRQMFTVPCCPLTLLPSQCLTPFFQFCIPFSPPQIQSSPCPPLPWNNVIFLHSLWTDEITSCLQTHQMSHIESLEVRMHQSAVSVVMFRPPRGAFRAFYSCKKI